MKCLVGGGFNLVAHYGWRGDNFEELLCETDLEITNDPTDEELDNSWTFRSSLGTKRVIDYCLVSNGMMTKASKPIDALNLRSDHRAVQSCVVMEVLGHRKKYRRKKRRINWDDYAAGCSKLHFPSRGHHIGGLETTLREIASICEIHTGTQLLRPWDCQTLKDLRVERNSTSNPIDRTKI